MGQPWKNGYDGVDAVGEISKPPAPKWGLKDVNEIIYDRKDKYFALEAPIWGLGVNLQILAI